ncbi:MAG: hypothetical protein ABI158_03740 [Edaphobacter sp.]
MLCSSRAWVRYALVSVIVFISSVAIGQAESAKLPPMPPPASPICENVPHSDHPHARITNGRMNAFVFLPDKEHGYYRAARFDWSGIVACASLNGHTFFGEWFSHYDPMTSDAVTGPSEEFREPLGYDDAKPGDAFVKVGVGVLKRQDGQPYKIGTSFPILDHGRWTVKVHKDSITFRQKLRSPLGYAYLYEKVLSLDKKTNVLHLTHSLKNVGTKPIDTTVYAHDFYMLDNKTTGPGMQVHFPFIPVPARPYPDSVRIEGTTVKWVAQMEPPHFASGEMTGYSDKVSDFDFTFEDTELGIGVQQTSDSPLAKIFFWSTPKTVCPEGFIGIHVAPGQTQTWKIDYRFFTK